MPPPLDGCKLRKEKGCYQEVPSILPVSFHRLLRFHAFGEDFVAYENVVGVLPTANVEKPKRRGSLAHARGAPVICGKGLWGRFCTIRRPRSSTPGIRPGALTTRADSPW